MKIPDAERHAYERYLDDLHCQTKMHSFFLEKSAHRSSPDFTDTTGSFKLPRDPG